MQGELHRLRVENARQSKRLIHANKRMLKYEADIRAELAVGGVGGGEESMGGDESHCAISTVAICIGRS